MQEYLGMKLDYREWSKVKIDMMDNLPYKYQVKAIKPAANYLFEENDTARKLINRDTQKFHTILAKIIFL